MGWGEGHQASWRQHLLKRRVHLSARVTGLETPSEVTRPRPAGEPTFLVIRADYNTNDAKLPLQACVHTSQRVENELYCAESNRRGSRIKGFHVPLGIIKLSPQSDT